MVSNTKPVGVAFADPDLTGGTQSGVAQTGGTLNACPIGGTTPAAGAFTTLTSSTAYASTDSGSRIAGRSGSALGFYAFTTAITANSTATTAPAGSFAITSNVTGVGKLFVSDGSLWQFAAIS